MTAAVVSRPVAHRVMASMRASKKEMKKVKIVTKNRRPRIKMQIKAGICTSLMIIAVLAREVGSQLQWMLFIKQTTASVNAVMMYRRKKPSK